ncbi:hypothetical protein BJ912DRAFT_407914 [Pholiota molesta]|nr:hypothetical protein BJ912DRAFT_407914 [Pholiota molesta]
MSTSDATNASTTQLCLCTTRSALQRRSEGCCVANELVAVPRMRQGIAVDMPQHTLNLLILGRARIVYSRTPPLYHLTARHASSQIMPLPSPLAPALLFAALCSNLGLISSLAHSVDDLPVVILCPCATRKDDHSPGKHGHMKQTSVSNHRALVQVRRKPCEAKHGAGFLRHGVGLGYWRPGCLWYSCGLGVDGARGERVGRVCAGLRARHARPGVSVGKGELEA